MTVNFLGEKKNIYIYIYNSIASYLLGKFSVLRHKGQLVCDLLYSTLIMVIAFHALKFVFANFEHFLAKL